MSDELGKSAEELHMNTRSTRRPVDEKKQTLKGRVTANLLNVRIEPNKLAQVVGQLKKDEIVEVLERLPDWFKITFRSGIAYIAVGFIEVISDSKQGKVTSTVLNVRKMPSSDAPVIGKLIKEAVVDIISDHGDWYEIHYQNSSAFIAKVYVSLNLDYKDSVNDTTSNVKVVTESNNDSITDPKNQNNTQTKGYFFKRSDLLNVALEPQKKVAVPEQRPDKTAALTWNSFGNLIDVISKELGIEVQASLAVLCVESGGKGFGPDNKMILRFENHIFHKYWGEKNQSLFDKHFQFNQTKKREEHKIRINENSPWEDCHTSQAQEWKAFELAKSLSAKEAMFSASIGAPQIMGFNFKSIGYTSPDEMYANFMKDIRFHLFALFDFCNYRPQRFDYLRKKDFYSFAEEYNGLTAPQQYADRIEEFYKVFKKML